MPQGDQIHHLLSAGKDRIERLLPGLDDELLELGCEHHDDAADFAQFANGAWRTRVESDLVITCFQRPLFEWAIRRRVLAKSNVVTHKGMAIGLIASEEGDRVVGARVRNAPGGELFGDLVVDATGRGSKAPHWVEDLGYVWPEEMELRVYMGYATLVVELPEGDLPEQIDGIMCGSSPDLPIGGAIRPCGNGQHIVVAYGVMKNYPPEDFEGVVEFLERLPTPLLAQCVRKATPVSDVKPYRMPGNLRRLWERMDRRPEGLVIVGDAVASFNPKYGQGMTMAAIGPPSSARRSRPRGGKIEGLARRVQSDLAAWVDIAFGNAVSVDGAYPDAEYENMEPVSAEERRLTGRSPTSRPRIPRSSSRPGAPSCTWTPRTSGPMPSGRRSRPEGASSVRSDPRRGILSGSPR